MFYDGLHTDEVEIGMMLDATAALDTATPVVWPASNAELVAAMGDYGQTFTDAWAMDAASGDEPNLIGSAALVPVNTPTQGAAGPGSDIAVEFPSDGTNAVMRCAAAASMDVTTGDLVILFTFKILTNPAAIRYLVSKIGVDFYGIQINTSGHLVLNVDGDAGLVTVTLAQDHRDGEWHDCIAVIDRDDGNIRIASDLGASAKQAVGGMGDITNAGLFGLGRNASITGHFGCAYLAASNHATGAGTLIDNLPAAITAFRAATGGR